MNKKKYAFILSVTSSFLILSIVLYLWYFKSAALANTFETNTNSIKIFKKELEIETNVSFSENNQIYWLSGFKKISQNENQAVYSLENHKIKIIRYISKYHQKITIDDHYINKTDQIIGVISNYKFLKFSPTSTEISGTEVKISDKLLAENPSILIKNNKTSFGIYLNDEFSKINSQIKINKNNQLNLFNDNLIIKPGNNYIKSFTIYKFNKLITYYDFINLLRKELKVLSYIDGNLLWLDTYANRKILKDVSAIKNILKNYGIKYIIINPWLDYDNYNFFKNQKWNRETFSEYLAEIKKKIKNVDPQIKLLVALQSNVVNLDTRIQNIIKDDNSNKIEKGFNHYNIDISNLIDMGIQKEEIIIDKNNRILFETYYHDWKYGNNKDIEEIALALKAYKDGYLFYKIIDQVNYAINEIQYDGVYIDQFNQHYISPKHTVSLDKENVNIGEINYFSGKITNVSENITLNTYEFRKSIIDFILTKTDVVFFNSHHISDSLRIKPVTRFAEGFWYFWAEKMWRENSRDFFQAKTFFGSHLSTPVSLSLSTIQKGDWQLDPHTALVKNLRFCLYNGNLMYFLNQDIKHLDTREKKENVFSKLYPINVKKIYQGKIIGERKIITIVDTKISKKDYHLYNFFYFNKNGYKIKNKKKKLTNINDEIIIHLEKDEILIMEKK